MSGELIDNSSKNEIVKVRLEVNRNKLHHSPDIYQPESKRLTNEIVRVIAEKLNDIPLDGEEVLLLEVYGLPGPGEMSQCRSSASIAANYMKDTIPNETVKGLLIAYNIIAESTSRVENNLPKNPKATIIVRHCIEKDNESYIFTKDRSESYYNQSILKYYVCRVSPKQEAIPEVPAESVLQKRSMSERFAGIFTKISGYFLSKK